MRYSFFQKILGSIFNCGLIITVGISLFCSKTDPSVNDPNWREESLKLASAFAIKWWNASKNLNPGKMERNS
jgi:uncharacterized membrane protein required for colicin V production